MGGPRPWASSARSGACGCPPVLSVCPHMVSCSASSLLPFVTQALVTGFQVHWIIQMTSSQDPLIISAKTFCPNTATLTVPGVRMWAHLSGHHHSAHSAPPFFSLPLSLDPHNLSRNTLKLPPQKKNTFSRPSALQTCATHLPLLRSATGLLYTGRYLYLVSDLPPDFFPIYSLEQFITREVERAIRLFKCSPFSPLSWFCGKDDIKIAILTIFASITGTYFSMLCDGL